MAASSTLKYQANLSYDRTTSNAVSPYITLGILVAGVVGGLIIVITFILFCKYCVKRKPVIRRDQGTDCERSSDRRFKPFQRYETINSDVFSEPSTGSMDGIPVSPRRLLEARSHEKITATTEEATETTKLKSDFDKTSYRETDIDLEAATVEQQKSETVKEAITCAGGSGGGGGGGGCGGGNASQETTSNGRRVSFDLENVTPTHGYLRKGRRYTDGDFHYLKKIRVKKNVPRQFSLGTQLRRDGCDIKPVESIELTPIPAIDECVNDNQPVQSTASTNPSAYPLVLDSPSPNGDMIGTQIVDVEVHFKTQHDVKRAPYRTHVGSFSKSGISPRLMKALKPTSYSMEAVSPTEVRARTNRRVKSYDDVLDYDYDVLKITEFSSGPFHNNEFDPIAEVHALSSAKVRYNDMGSLEVLNEDKLYSYDDDSDYEHIFPDESDADTDATINGSQKYRELWNLRRTLEEEEECSDTIRMEDMASPDEPSSPDRDVGGASYSPTYHPATETPRFHNNNTYKPAHLPTHHVVYPDPQRAELGENNSNFLHPNYENSRRECYKTVLHRRYNQKRGSTSAETSFDSVETVDTDGDVSDTSRHEVTTSFESTTDNTDSTNDSQTSKLRQMKADSGYKSLEAQHSTTMAVTNGRRKSQSMDDEILVLESSVPCTSSRVNEVLEGVGICEAVPRRNGIFEKRKGRTASKRRREYSRERQVVRLYDSVYENETDSTRSDQPSGDSIEEQHPQNSKFSVFSRFFKSQKFSRCKSLSRDFSIDEKSNSIFQEFVRYDPKLENYRGSTGGIRLAGNDNRRYRLQRKYTDPGPGIYDETSRHWLSPEMRSTSLGSDSSASSARRISPQDSIEEEIEDDIDAAVLDHKNRILEQKNSKQEDVTTPTVSIHEIPIIRLPEGETVDA